MKGAFQLGPLRQRRPTRNPQPDNSREAQAAAALVHDGSLSRDLDTKQAIDNPSLRVEDETLPWSTSSTWTHTASPSTGSRTRHFDALSHVLYQGNNVKRAIRRALSSLAEPRPGWQCAR
jgi:hypothetical protein